MYVSTFTSSNSTLIIKIALVALLILILPYITLTLLRHLSVYAYPVSLVATLTAIIGGKCAWYLWGWSVSYTIVGSYLMLGVAAASCYRLSLRFFVLPLPAATTSSKLSTEASHPKNQFESKFCQLQLTGPRNPNQNPLFPPQAVLAQMSHFWLSLSLLFALTTQSWLALVLVVATLVYGGRSYYERNIKLLILAGIGSTWAVWVIVQQAAWTTAWSGLALIGLGAAYLGLGLRVRLVARQTRLQITQLSMINMGSRDEPDPLEAKQRLKLRTSRLKKVKKEQYQQWTGKLCYGQGLALYGLGLAVAASSGYNFSTRTFESGGPNWFLGNAPTTLLIIMLGLVLIESVTSLIAWLEQAEWASWLALANFLGVYILAFQRLGLNWNWLGLSLFLPASVVLLISLKLTRRIATNLQRVALGLTLIGLPLSWHEAWLLLIHSGALAIIGWTCLKITKKIEWLYATLLAAHVAYLVGWSLWLKIPYLNASQAALALLGVGLLQTLLAQQSVSANTNQNLSQIINQLRDNYGGWGQLQSLKGLPFYLAATLDLSCALLLATTQPFTIKILVTGSIALALGWVALAEQNKQVGWGSLCLVIVEVLELTFKQEPHASAIFLALIALALSCSGYILEKWQFSKILAVPTRQAAHILAVSAVWVWPLLLKHYYSFTLDSLSWLLGILGLNYLVISLLEQRRSIASQLNWRYISYGSVLLLEIAFVLRLSLSNVGQLQFYVLPLGLICLVCGWQERLHTNQRLAWLLESVGLTILLGTSLLQALGLQTLQLDKAWYGWGLLIEALIVLGFGIINRLRYYFFGSISALLLDLVALSADTIRTADKWVVIGTTGLVLITLALFLERKREMVLGLSKDWLERWQQWE
jgi:hypothetical protein